MTPNPNQQLEKLHGPWPRYLNAAIGVWLFISAFAWPHTDASRTNTWIVGLITFVISLVAVKTPPARYANTIVAIWLFIATVSMSHISRGTVWNNVIAAIVLFVVSLIPSGRGHAATVR